MELGESLEAATACAGGALATMTRLGVKPSPPNFEIWYRHATGRYPELSRRLEVVERSGGSFDDARNAQLHELFFGVAVRRGGLQGSAGGSSGSGSSWTRPPRMSARSGRLSRASARALWRRAALGAIRWSPRPSARPHASWITPAGWRAGSPKPREPSLTYTTISPPPGADTGVAVLTGVASRERFDLRHDEDVADRPATGEPLSLLLIDVDRFEAFNDAHGRPLGDRVLTLMARALTRSIKGRGLVTRYAGDQFATLLPRTALADAATLANQLRRLIAANRIVIKGTGRDLGAITLSIGVAEYKLREPLGHLLRRAGEALQLAKRAGGNRVNVADCTVAGAAAGELVRPAIAPAAGAA